MESVLVDPQGMGRTVHLRADVILQPGESLDQLRFFLHAGLIGMRDVVRQVPNDGSARRSPFLDLPFANAEQFRHIVTHGGICGDFWELAQGQQQALGNLATKAHGT